MDDSRQNKQDAQNNIDPELLSHANLHECCHGRKKNRENYSENFHQRLLFKL
jgi:hypothetical protein